jgi:hypothetical protein
MGTEARTNPGSREFTGPAVVLEARGRELKEGDEIILQIPGPIYFRVAQITPVLDPALPPGLVYVHVGCMLTFTAKRSQINREFIRVRTGEEAGPSMFKLLDAQPQGQPQDETAKAAGPHRIEEDPRD